MSYLSRGFGDGLMRACASMEIHFSLRCLFIFVNESADAVSVTRNEFVNFRTRYLGYSFKNQLGDVKEVSRVYHNPLLFLLDSNNPRLILYRLSEHVSIWGLTSIAPMSYSLILFLCASPQLGRWWHDIQLATKPRAYIRFTLYVVLCRGINPYAYILLGVRQIKYKTLEGTLVLSHKQMEHLELNGIDKGFATKDGGGFQKRRQKERIEKLKNAMKVTVVRTLKGVHRFMSVVSRGEQNPWSTTGYLHCSQNITISGSWPKRRRLSEPTL